MTMNRRATLALAFAGLMTATTGAWAADVNIRIHTLVKSPHPYNDMADHIKTALEAESDGKIGVTIFDSGQLGQDPAVIGEVALGTIDMIVSSASNIAGEVPELSIFTMPYLFASMDEVVEKVGPGTPGNDHFSAAFDERLPGVKLLAIGASGTRNMSAVEVSITSPDDLDGMRMRTTQSPMDANTWSALGMLPVSVAWGELYAAMQTGVADAMESSLPGYTGSKLYEVAPNLALTGHQVQINYIAVAQRTWDKLDADMQALVEKVAAEANLLGVEKAKEYDGALVETLQSEHGVTVSRPDQSAFVAVLEPIQVELAQSLDLEAEYNLLKGK